MVCVQCPTFSTICPNLKEVLLAGGSVVLSEYSLQRFFSQRQTKLQSLTLDYVPKVMHSFAMALKSYEYQWQLLAVSKLQRLHLCNVDEHILTHGFGLEFAVILKANKFLEQVLFSSVRPLVDEFTILSSYTATFDGELLALPEANARRHIAFLSVVNRLSLKPGAHFAI